MKIEIEVRLSKDYYQEFYKEWLAFRSKGKKWQLLISISLIGWAAILAAMIDTSPGNLWLIPALFVLVGIYELGEFYVTKRQWLRSRADSHLMNQKVKLIFENQIIKHIGPFSTGEISWAGIRQVKETPNGIFLIPENGISIYLPKHAFQSSAQIQDVLDRANK